VPEGRVKGWFMAPMRKIFRWNLFPEPGIKKTYGFDFANVFRHVPLPGKEVLNVIVRGW